MMKNRRRLVLLALIALAVPLFADSPEVQVGATVSAPAPSYRRALAAATDGTDFFVVWTDTRTPGRVGIMGTRVSRGGQVLDPFGIRIASVPAGMSWPAAVWDGAAYVVVWTQGNHFGDNTQRNEMWIARVGRDGRTLLAPRLIADTAMTTRGVYAASNGSVTVIAWRDRSSAGAVRLTVLDRDGEIVHRAAFENHSYDFDFPISVAATATRFLVTWGTGESKLFAVALRSDGHFIGTPVELGDGEDPAVATDGTSFRIAWRRWMPDVKKWVLMSRTADAELAQLGGVRMLASDQTIESLSMLWRGDRYELIAGQQSGTPQKVEPYGLLSVEIESDDVGLVSHRRGDPLLNSGQAQPVAVTNGSDVLVAYTDPDGSSIQIVARIYRGNSPEPDVQQLLSWSGNAHERPAIASSASGHFAVWIENFSVYATRIDLNGNSLDGRGVKIAGVGFAVRVAFDGTNYVVAWVDNGFLGVRTIAPATGATVAEVHVPAPVSPPWSFALAVSPEAAYLAWIGEKDSRVRMTRVSTASHTADLPIAVSPAGMPVDRPAIAWNGSMLLVAWNGLGIPPVGLPNIQALDVQAARVSPGLLLLDPAPMTVVTTEAFPLGAPSIASNGEDWLVVTDRGAQQIVARRVLRSGNVEGTAASAIGDGIAPAVTWNGTRYAIAYKSGGTELLPEHPLLLGAVPATGELPIMHPALVATDVVSPPSIARTAAGDVAFVYTKVSFRPEHLGVERSYFRVMDFASRRRVVRH